MKIGPSTIGAVVFTAVSVAAFGWLTQRPKAEGQAIGFAMPSSGGAASSSSAGTQVVKEPKVADSNDDLLSMDEVTNNADAENAAEKTEASASESNPTETTATESTAEELKTVETSSSDSSANVQQPSAGSVIAPAAVATMAQTSEPVSTDSTSSSGNTEAIPPTPTTSDSTQASIESTVSSTAETQTPATADQAQTNPTEASEQAAEGSQATANATTAIQTVQLKSANGTSAGVYSAATSATGTVVILHGCDYKPEGKDDVVRPLHEGLPKEGWNTLSLQLPNLSASSTFKDLEAIMPDAVIRIESGIAMAKEKSQTPVVLFAHGCGAQVALAWMEVKGSDSINGYIGLGAGVMNASADDSSHLRLPLEKMKFPQLDIYGSADNEAVLKTAPERLSYINRASNPASRQKKIEGADHNITGKGKELSDVLVKWLNGLAFKK
ncbi:MAG TPA: DUF3530 family protein [Leucothrix mucor]|nr:DUF3530 family protein [Leucothrix mucor]